MRVFTKSLVYLLGCLLLLVFACRESATHKPLSLEDIRPKSKQKIPVDPKKNQPDTLQSLVNFYANDSSRLQIAKIERDRSEIKHFLNRFSPQNQHFILTDSSNSIFYYRRWQFKDSSSCYEAFYNWVDQTANKKVSAGILSSHLIVGRPTLYIVNNANIFEISSEKPFKYNNWIQWSKGIADSKTLKYACIAKPKGKSKWLNPKQ